MTFFIEDNTISGNSSNSKGGGLYFYDHCTATVQNNIISHNEAWVSGGGVVLWIGCRAEMVNNLLVDNEAIGGGGLWVHRTGTLTLRNMTIAHNRALNGGGLFLNHNSQATAINTIFWGNEATRGEAFWIGSSERPSVMNINHSNAQAGRRAIYVALESQLLWGAGMDNSDPLFIDPVAGNYRLCQHPCEEEVKNPCVDTGHPMSPMIPGTTRTDCCCDVEPVDMGYHAPIPNSVATEIWVRPDSGVLPFSARASATISNKLGVERTVAGTISVTLANGTTYRGLQPGVVVLGPYESHVTAWNQQFPASERFLGLNIFELEATDITPAPYNQAPYPASGDIDRDLATVAGQQ
jgi:hypothetical protein